MRYTFTIQERLKREQHIKTLFHTGKAFSAFPLKCIWLLRPDLPNSELSRIRIAFSVPKKRFARAVDRNRIKRLMREAWRHQKHELQPMIPSGSQLHLFFIFTGNTDALPVAGDITAAVVQLKEHLKRKLIRDE